MLLKVLLAFFYCLAIFGKRHHFQADNGESLHHKRAQTRPIIHQIQNVNNDDESSRSEIVSLFNDFLAIHIYEHVPITFFKKYIPIVGAYLQDESLDASTKELLLISLAEFVAFGPLEAEDKDVSDFKVYIYEFKAEVYPRKANEEYIRLDLLDGWIDGFVGMLRKKNFGPYHLRYICSTLQALRKYLRLNLTKVEAKDTLLDACTEYLAAIEKRPVHSFLNPLKAYLNGGQLAHLEELIVQYKEMIYGRCECDDLLEAIGEHRIDLAVAILEFGGSKLVEHNHDLLLTVCSGNHIALLKVMLELYADNIDLTANENEAYHLAELNGHTDIMRLIQVNVRMQPSKRTRADLNGNKQLETRSADIDVEGKYLKRQRTENARRHLNIAEVEIEEKSKDEPLTSVEEKSLAEKIKDAIKHDDLDEFDQLADLHDHKLNVSAAFMTAIKYHGKSIILRLLELPNVLCNIYLWGLLVTSNIFTEYESSVVLAVKSKDFLAFVSTFPSDAAKYNYELLDWALAASLHLDNREVVDLLIELVATSKEDLGRYRSLNKVLGEVSSLGLKGIELSYEQITVIYSKLRNTK